MIKPRRNICNVVSRGSWVILGSISIWAREFPMQTSFVTAIWTFWHRHLVKSTFLVGLRQNKAQKSRKHVKMCPLRSFSVVLTHFDTRHSTQASSRGAWARMHTRQHFVILTPFELQNRPRSPRKTFSLIFYAFFSSFLGFILPKTDQKCTFMEI